MATHRYRPLLLADDEQETKSMITSWVRFNAKHGSAWTELCHEKRKVGRRCLNDSTDCVRHLLRSHEFAVGLLQREPRGQGKEEHALKPSLPPPVPKCAANPRGIAC
ncbi:hypothetical protein N7447_002388 [Penicillium robsamsonii]|uniref:uncharacterized protein n=1 Tax=Penicillium robsamsonii TaxID=1792511 RepID=UPI0025489E99|nr:uncharacterized protein N7447_002388 [Penicillium robsamsonii]KAJ5836362.1 hypothetical protein N7447_002388 [Penicillium robsamsonii]